MSWSKSAIEPVRMGAEGYGVIIKTGETSRLELTIRIHGSTVTIAVRNLEPRDSELNSWDCEGETLYSTPKPQAEGQPGTRVVARDVARGTARYALPDCLRNGCCAVDSQKFLSCLFALLIPIVALVALLPPSVHVSDVSSSSYNHIKKITPY